MRCNIRNSAKFLIVFSIFILTSESLILTEYSAATHSSAIEKKDENEIITDAETKFKWIATGDMITKIPIDRRLDDINDTRFDEDDFLPIDTNDKKKPSSKSGQDSFWGLYDQLDNGKNLPIYTQQGGGKPILSRFRYIFVPIWWSDEDTTDPDKVIRSKVINNVMDYNMEYYKRMSFGKFNFHNHIILPQVVIPVSSKNPDFGDLDNAALRVVDKKGYVQNKDYDGVVVLYNIAKDGPFSGHGGWGSVNSDLAITNMSWRWGLSNDVARHEFGHNFGHPHHLTNGYKLRFGEEGTVGYDDYDMMSGGNHYDISDFALASKWFFGWVPDSSIINMQPQGSTLSCPKCTSEGTYKLFPFDGDDASKLMGIHIPITQRSNTLYSYWLSYRSNNGAENGLSIHVSWFGEIGTGQFGASYDSLNYDAHGDTITREDSFVLPGSCYHISPSIKMIEIDPLASIATQPVVCVNTLSVSKSITIDVSFVSPSSPLEAKITRNGSNYLNNELKRTSLIGKDEIVMQCGTSKKLIVKSNTDQLVHVDNTGLNGTLTLKVSSTLATASATAYVYDRYPTSPIEYSAPGGYGAFKSLSVASNAKLIEYRSIHNNAWVLIKANSAVTFDASCTVNKCQIGQKKVGKKCIPCKDNESTCETCPGGLEFLISACVISETVKEIARSKRWRIWTPDYHTLTGWNWDIKDIRFYSEDDCTGTIFNDGKPIDSGNAGEGWEAGNSFDFSSESPWGGRADQFNLFWIGMTFNGLKKVKCVSILDEEENGVSELRVQAWESSTSTWQNVKIVKNYQSGKGNNIPLKYTSTLPPTESPVASPTSSCTQDDNDRFLHSGKTVKTCGWLSSRGKWLQGKICQQGLKFSDTHSPAENVCEKTCKSCDPCFENPTMKSRFFLKFRNGNAIYKTCKWLKNGNRATTFCKKKASNEGRGSPKKVCPKICSKVTTCPSN